MTAILVDEKQPSGHVAPMAKRGKPDPDIIFKVRNPESGLFLGAKGSKWTKQSWSKTGTNYPTAERARTAVEHYILNCGDVALEIVKLRVSEMAVETVQLPQLDPVRALIRAFSARDSGNDPLWYALSTHGFSSFIFERVKAGKPLPLHYVWVRGWDTAVDTLNLSGTYEKGRYHDRKRTIVGLDDDASLVALRLVVPVDDVIQIWDQYGTLVEGEQWTMG